MEEELETLRLDNSYLVKMNETLNKRIKTLQKTLDLSISAENKMIIGAVLTLINISLIIPMIL